MVATLDIPGDFIEQFGADDAATALGNGSYNGQKYRQIGDVAQGFRISSWYWDATNTVWVCAPEAPIQGSGNPNGTVTPDAINQGFLDTATGNLYQSTGTTNNDWLLTN